MSNDLKKRLRRRWPNEDPKTQAEKREAAERIEELEAKLALLMDAAESAIGHIERIPPRLATARVELCDALAELKEEDQG